MKKTRIAAFAGAMILFLAGPVVANPFNVFGFDSKSTAMGGAYTALAHGVEATYFNPAGLTEGKNVETILGYSYAQPTIDIKMTDGRPNVLMDPAKDPPASQGYLLGFAIPPLPALKKVAVGISTYVPNARLVEELFGDKQRPFVLDYQRQASELMVIPAAAYEIVPMMSLGIGAMVGAHLAIINSPGNTLVGNIEGSLKGWAAPEAGILVKPMEGLKLGLSYRGKYSSDSDTILNILGQNIRMKGVTLYSPLQITGGGAYTIDNITASVDVLYSVWEDYKPPFTEAEILGSGITIASFGNANFKNTIIPRVGVEYRLTDLVALRGGYYFKPSPVPDQTAETNIIDNDTHVGSLGVGLALPVKGLDNPIKIDLHVQYQKFAERTTKKKTLPPGEEFNPGRPGYTVNGDAISGGINLTVAYY